MAARRRSIDPAKGRGPTSVPDARCQRRVAPGPVVAAGVEGQRVLDSMAPKWVRHGKEMVPLKRPFFVPGPP